MDNTINKSLSHLENTTIKLLEKSAEDPINRYNTICNMYLSNGFLSKAGLGSLGAILLKASKVTTSIAPLSGSATALALPAASSATLALPAASSTALVTTGSTALSTTVATGSVGGTAACAGGSSVIPVIGPMIAAAVGGFMVGKAIGDSVLEYYVYPKEAKKLLDQLGVGAKCLKNYCKSMDTKLAAAIENVNVAISKIDRAANKIKNSEYETKTNNLSRMQSRKTELVTLARDMGELRKVISALYENLFKII